MLGKGTYVGTDTDILVDVVAGVCGKSFLLASVLWEWSKEGWGDTRGWERREGMK